MSNPTCNLGTELESFAIVVVCVHEGTVICPTLYFYICFFKKRNHFIVSFAAVQFSPHFSRCLSEEPIQSLLWLIVMVNVNFVMIIDNLTDSKNCLGDRHLVMSVGNYFELIYSYEKTYFYYGQELFPQQEILE